MTTNLFDLMSEVVDEYVKNYKHDFELDKEDILNGASNTYYWYVRESGTELIDSEAMLFKDTVDNIEANYWYKYATRVYKINIVKRGRKYVYGTLEVMDKKKFHKLLENNCKNYEAIQCSAKISGKNNKVVVPKGNNINAPLEDRIRETLKLKDNVSITDIKIIKYLELSTII